MSSSSTPLPRSDDDCVDPPVSSRIRARLISARQRYHANDNISAYVMDGEVDALRIEVEAKMAEVLKSLVIDTESDHNTQGTARRVAKMFLTEVFKGRYHAMPAVTEFPNIEQLNELLIVGPITARSACSHHLCPILGKVWIGIMPNENSNLIGLSKYARICDWVMSRPQIQEEAVMQLANILQDKVKPDGLAIVIEADHFCMHWRGVDDVSQEELMTILSQSKSHNPASGITGVLCSSGRLFLQLLEGGRMQVNALYNQIAADARHKDVVILSYEEISERRFAHWSMGLVNLERVNASVLLKYSESATLDPYGVSGTASMALLGELMATASIVGRADLLPAARQ